MSGEEKLQHFKARVSQWLRPNRAKVPGVLQMEAVECGAASLAMLLGYYGRMLPLEQLRLDCNVTRDGTNAANLARAARKHGLKAKGFRKEPAQLAQLPMPAIIHWNFNHFLVLEGIVGDKVYLNDPAGGRRTVTKTDLDRSFTGVVLVMEKADDFEPVRAKPTLAEQMRQRLAKSRIDLLFILLVTLGLVLPALVIPAFTKIFIDQYLVNQLSDWVPMLLLAMAGMLCLSALLTWLQQRALLRLETRLALSSSSRFLWHVLQLPLAFFSQRHPGEIASRVTVNDRVARLLSGEFANLALSMLTMLFFFALMLAYDWVLASLSAAIALVNVVMLRLFNALRADASRRLQQDTGKLVGTTMSGLQSIETLKASGGEADYYTKWIGNFGKVINAEQRLGLTDRVLGIFPKLTESINVTAVLVVGSLRVMDGNMSMGTVIAFYYLLANFLAPVARFVQVGSMLQTAEADLSRIDDVMRYTPQRGLGMNEAALTDEQESNVLSSTVAPSSKLSGAVEVRGLSFGYYSLGRPLIKELDLSLEPGSRTALVGGSGSGKSTIAKLVCNLHQPWSGDILFDGQPRTNIARDMLSRSLALVDQEIMVYQGTVRDNVCLWDPTLPETSIVRACRDACIHDEIMSRPGGYDSPISEGGTNFSGGQLQRLELARALANDPSILVLDEATSALDTHSEMQVMENLRRRGCTVLLVSHRLSAIRDCDEIIVLKFGEIAERGSHRDLVSADGHYVELLGAA